MTAYYPDSFAGVGLRARNLAMQGADATELSERLDLPLHFCEHVVSECKEHKKQWAEVLQK